MKNKIELNEVLQLDSLVALGKKEGLKYFKKVNKEYSVQDLCKHWQISSATFYSKYAKQIGHKPKSRSKTKVNFTLKDNEIIDTKLKNKENINPIHMDIIPDIVKNKETTMVLEEGLTEIINNKIEDNNLIDNQNEVCT
ncbi:MAG: hypothetical protein IJH34_07390, partial [Romboutsia sp.]|nr:hypothetical protein [Romboutsia sp.]